MNSAFESVNERGLLKVKPLYTPKDLEKGVLYNIVKATFTKSKYATRSVLVESELFSIFLPKRISDAITDDLMSELNTGNYHLIYEGEKFFKNNQYPAQLFQIKRKGKLFLI